MLVKYNPNAHYFEINNLVVKGLAPCTRPWRENSLSAVRTISLAEAACGSISSLAEGNRNPRLGSISVGHVAQ